MKLLELFPETDINTYLESVLGKDVVSELGSYSNKLATYLALKYGANFRITALLLSLHEDIPEADESTLGTVIQAMRGTGRDIAFIVLKNLYLVFDARAVSQRWLCPEHRVPLKANRCPICGKEYTRDTVLVQRIYNAVNPTYKLVVQVSLQDDIEPSWSMTGVKMTLAGILVLGEESAVFYTMKILEVKPLLKQVAPVYSGGESRAESGEDLKRKIMEFINRQTLLGKKVNISMVEKQFGVKGSEIEKLLPECRVDDEGYVDCSGETV